MHTGVGFCVARSTEMGNAKASECGTGDGKDSHAFCVSEVKVIHSKLIRLGNLSEANRLYMKENLLKRLFGQCANLKGCILILLFSFFSLSALCSEISFKDDNFNYSIIDATSVAISANKSLSGIVTIPSSVTYDGKTYIVTTIGKSGFSWQENIVSIILPETIKKISDEAFCYCSSLLKINIPESVSEIGEYAFGSCKSLTEMTLPKSMTSIPANLFYECI